MTNLIENVIVSQELVNNPKKPWLNIAGATSEMELDWLHYNAHNKKHIYEIGSFFGRSTVALLESGSSVTAVDDFKGMREERMSETFRDNIYHEFLKNTRKYENLDILKVDHAQFIPTGECDMVFIDGSHLYDHVMRDIQKFKNHKNILICGHDFSWWQSVREAVVHSFKREVKLHGPNLWYVKQ
jgi:predicted O-methyltransferase YrrM